MCSLTRFRVSWKLLASVGVVLGVIAVLLWSPTSAHAGHCPSGATVTGTPKDHLPDGSCGFFVLPVSSPSPSSTPTPAPTLPVRVENRPDVRVVQPETDPPFVVKVSNFRQFASTETEGWNDYDRDVLEAMQADLAAMRVNVTLGFGLALLFAGATLIVSLRRK
jgi:hypothetical protein